MRGCKKKNNKIKKKKDSVVVLSRPINVSLSGVVIPYA